MERVMFMAILQGVRRFGLGNREGVRNKNHNCDRKKRVNFPNTFGQGYQCQS